MAYRDILDLAHGTYINVKLLTYCDGWLFDHGMREGLLDYIYQ